MLKLKNLKKDYVVSNGDNVHALKGVSVNFRRNEFVAILGPSGCGKTTLLNIIGGLDRYTSGELFIEGKSTKKYNDRDYDTYRNHSIGFVFQSYNLINHISVLANVELALTISGRKKEDRHKKVLKVLEKVGLRDLAHKKPNQLSGGQMQRVAIARALVNDPEVLLADEPTGALDSETSIQIMDLLKEVASDRLVIMVTHNPDLAHQYASRIIKMSDGILTSDSSPYEGESLEQLNSFKNKKNSSLKGTKKRTSMSFFTALSLSLRNLMSKKWRTFLVSFAASIGIIGISLILSVSYGFNNYVKDVQTNALSTYPVTISKSVGADLTNLLNVNLSSEKEDFPSDGEVGENRGISDLIYNLTQTKSNDTKSFKAYLEQESVKEKYGNCWNDIQYDYGNKMNIYVGKNLDGVQEDDITRLSPVSFSGSESYLTKASTYRGVEDIDKDSDFIYKNVVFPEVLSRLSSIVASTDTEPFDELLDNETLLNNQYDVLIGKFPTKYDEIVMRVDTHNNIDDFSLCGLGLKDVSYMLSQLAYPFKESYPDFNLSEPKESEPFSCQISDLMNLTFKVSLTSQSFKKVENGYQNIYYDNSKIVSNEMKDKILNKSIELKVVGVIRQKEGVTASSLRGVVGYRRDLIDYIYEQSINPTDERFIDDTVLKDQLANPGIDVLTGTSFDGSLTNTYEMNLKKLGHYEKDNPSVIYIYPKNLAGKEKIKEMVSEYNNSVTEDKKIKMSDNIDILMGSVSTIIDSVSYVLIAFVSISLIVSSIMIAIITYVSVLERVKEIGVLRSIGARKKDIARVFDAETLIIGLSAGLLGVGISLLLDIPLTLIIKALADIAIRIVVPWYGILILPAISVALTLIAGFIPSSIAAKKDPVIALRSE